MPVGPTTLWPVKASRSGRSSTGMAARSIGSWGAAWEASTTTIAPTTTIAEGIVRETGTLEGQGAGEPLLLRFVDPRTFGEMFVTAYDGIEDQVDELAHLGIDPLETAMSWDAFGRMLATRSTKLNNCDMN